jgi:hypothetical protein
VIITFFIMGKRRYNWKERVFYAVAWTPKATVQASLSAVPLALINSALAGQPDYAQWQKWGDDVLATGIFAIIVCGTFGTLLVYWLAPVLLEKEVCAALVGRLSVPAMLHDDCRSACTALSHDVMCSAVLCTVSGHYRTHCQAVLAWHALQEPREDQTPMQRTSKEVSRTASLMQRQRSLGRDMASMLSTG